MEFRLGGLYLQEMKELRAGGASLAEVVEHFLRKDAEMRQQARRKARLEAQAKVNCGCEHGYFAVRIQISSQTYTVFSYV